MRYVITKEVEAASLEQALKNEPKAELIDICKKEDSEVPPPMGFKA